MLTAAHATLSGPHAAKTKYASKEPTALF